MIRNKKNDHNLVRRYLEATLRLLLLQQINCRKVPSTLAPAISTFSDLRILNRNLPIITSIGQGGVVAYPVMEEYGSLALEDNSEIGEAVQGRCSISCICTSAL